MARLASILSSNRRRLFVGRKRELAQAQALLQPNAPLRLLFIAAPGGAGKSTLLAEIGARALDAGLGVAHIDARHHEPSPAVARSAIEAELRTQKNRALLCVDTFESWAALEGWFQHELLPALDRDIRVVLAGRRKPAAEWRADPSWADIMRVLELPNFTVAEARECLRRRGIKRGIAAVIHYAHGNPLALSLAAELCAARRAAVLAAQPGHDLLRELAGILVRVAVSDEQAQALHAAAIARNLDRPLLKAMLPATDTNSLYDWLNGLSFMSAGPHGLFPHDLVRAAVREDLSTREPERHEQLHRRLEERLSQQMRHGARATYEAVQDILFLSQDSARGANIHQIDPNRPVYIDSPGKNDPAAVAALIERWQGAEQRRLFQYWHARQPEGLQIIRDQRQGLAGFLFSLALERVSAQAARRDSIVVEVRRELQRRGHIADRPAGLCRFWLDRRRHLAVSAVQSAVWAASIAADLAIPGLQFFAGIMADDQGRIHARVAGHERLPQTAHRLGGVAVAIYLHDFRDESVPDWVMRVSRELRGAAVSGAAQLQLDRCQFRDAVKQVLRHYTNASRLGDNPLLRTSLIEAAVPAGADISVRVHALRALLWQASSELERVPKTRRYHKVLLHSYFRPAVDRLAAADAAHLAPSTYYRYLATAIDMVSERLWCRLQGVEPPDPLSTPGRKQVGESAQIL